MTISPVNISRVSHNLRTTFVVDSLRRTQRNLFIAQAQIATGRRFVTPSEDPVSASRALDLTQALDQQKQFMANLRYGDNFLSAADSSLTEINDLLLQTSVIASQTVSSLTTAAERDAEAEVIARIREQLETLANRRFSGRYLFGGRQTVDQPFINALGGLAYVGDGQALMVRVDEALNTAISVPGSLLFGALSKPISTDADLTPKLTESTRLDTITGAQGAAIRQGMLVFNEADGVGVFTVNLADADTIGDIVDAINSAATEAGSTLTASLGDTGLVIAPGGAAVTVTDTGTGSVAADLGLLSKEATTASVDGQALTARLTRLTPVDALVGGEGIDLEKGFIVTNGTRTATVDLSDAETVQDVINIINNADVFVLARINEEGTGLDVFNQVAGTSLTIGENGGTTATDLGIRTLDTATPLDRLNFGLGVTITEGVDDFRITTKSGSTVDVNLDGAVTIGDVIDLIGEAATDQGVTVSAEFAGTGNGIRLSDGTGGTGDLSVSILNLSTAAIDLGLVQTVSGTETELVGDDVNPTRTEGLIGALIDLERALRNDDTQRITIAAARIDELRFEATRIHGIIGARSQALKGKLIQMEDAATTTELFLSEVQDLDYAEAVTRLQAALTQLQANLQTSSNLLNLSLLSFLR